jgi:hypothetical protein
MQIEVDQRTTAQLLIACRLLMLAIDAITDEVARTRAQDRQRKRESPRGAGR